MSSVRQLPIPEDLEREIDLETARRGASWSEIAVELLDEAIRMRRVPGIMFVDGPAGRRAAVVGTGLDVWEIIGTFKEVDQDLVRLRRAYDWLTEPQLQSALRYYELYPEKIDDRLVREASWTLDRVRAELPFTRVQS